MKIYQGWKVAFAGMGINFLVGISYAWSILATGLSREFGWTQAQTALPYTLFIFTYALLMVVAGRVQDRIGPRLTATVGGFLVGASFILSSLVMIPYGVAVIWGVLFGAGLACCFGSVTPAAVKWFPPERQGVVTGLVVTGIGLSALVLAPTVHLLVERSVTMAFWVIGLFLIVGVVLLAQFLSIPPRKNNATVNPGGQECWKNIFRYRQFYLMWIMFLLATTTGVTFAAHLTRIVEVHASFEQGYIMVTLFALFNTVGRFVAGWLSDLLGRGRSMTVIFAVLAMTMALVIKADSALLMGIAVSFLGMAYGGIYTIFPAATVSYFGEANFGFNYGLIFSALGVAGMFSFFTGRIFDASGSFTSAFVMLMFFCLAAMAISFFLKAPAKHEKPAQRATA